MVACSETRKPKAAASAGVAAMSESFYDERARAAVVETIRRLSIHAAVVLGDCHAREVA